MTLEEESVETRVVEPRSKYLVLLLLAEGPKTGYELLKAIRALLADAGKGVSPGTIYPLLRHLEESGCIEIVEEQKGGRRKKVYRLTGKGARVLALMALKGLGIVEALLRLHLRAAEKLKSTTLPFEANILAEIINKLRIIEGLTKKMREQLEQGLKDGVMSGPTEGVMNEGETD